jgi:3-hydroxybutyrate dehydrogenase
MLKGRCALITGATGGLGRTIALHLAGEGCNIVLNGRAAAGEAEEQRRDLEARYGIRAIYHEADLGDPDAISAMMAASAAAFGAIDVLVNNAVVRHFAPVDAFPVERWDEALAVNLSAAFHTIRHAVPAMRARNFGRIVNLGSAYSFIGAAGRVDYVTTKTALLGLTRAVAMDVIGHDITCNAICPATIETPPIARRIEDLALDQGLAREAAVARYLAQRQPSGRFIKAENVAALVMFLCSPAGSDITGTALPVDGGWMAS